MTTKHITGTYLAGYTLSAAFSAVRIAAAGEIYGAGLTVSRQSVYNFGKATATDAGATGVLLGGTGVLTNAAGGLIAGGAGADYQYRGFGGAGGTAVVDNARRGPITNKGSIVGGYGGVGIRRGGAGGAGLSDGGRRSPIDNQGFVSGGDGGYGRDYQYFDNGAPGFGGPGGAGVVLSVANLVQNSGEIVGGNGGDGAQGRYGSGPGGGADGGDGIRMLAGGRLTNSGAITGGGGGIANYGGYGGDGGAGVRLDGGRLHNTGLIRGGDGGPAVHFSDAAAGGDGVAQSGGGTIFNGGTILAGAGHAPAPPSAQPVGVLLTGTLRNSGLIAGYYGVAVTNSSARVVNDGIIKAAYYRGGKAYEGYAGVALRSGGRLDNHGLVEGGYVGVKARFGGTVVNSGTIEGSSSSVVLDSSSTLIARSGATFIGSIVGGGGTFDLAGGTGDLSGLGAGGVISGTDSGAFSGFDGYVIGGGGHWTLTGAGALTSGQTLTVGGGLVVGAGGQLSEASGATITVARHGNLRFGAASQTLSGSLVDDGLIAVQNGAALTLAGTVSGGGGVVVNDGLLQAEAAFNLAVTFARGGGTVELAESRGFTAAIAGFAASDILDLGDIAFNGGSQLSYSGNSSGGVLTVTDGAHTAMLHLSGDYTSAVFAAAGDGGGGVDVTVAPGASATAFAAAIAGLGSVPMAGAPMAHVGAAGPAPPRLVAPRDHWA